MSTYVERAVVRRRAAVPSTYYSEYVERAASW
jgi:hypothetical protein